jgi:hypothetical protein
MQLSGKLVVSSIVTIAILLAGASWWFRYAATNKAGRYWGAQNVRLIRDAPVVEFYRWALDPESLDELLAEGNRRDVSQRPGLLHLRSALLEDRSFEWPASDVVPGNWECVLVFRDEGGDSRAIVLITSDWKYLGLPKQKSLSCEPISEGLAEFFGDLLADLRSASGDSR